MDAADAAREAAASLVRSKYALDSERRAARKHPIQPAGFIEYALPYANTAHRSRVGPFDFVPSELVVGATWAPRWHPLPQGSEALALCDRLDENVRNRSETWPLLYQVGSLPLWFANEGKNRVELYQSLGRPILGELRSASHTAPAELVISRGPTISGVRLKSGPEVFLPLLVRPAADLLIASGAEKGPPLTEEVQRQLERVSVGRDALLEIPW